MYRVRAARQRFALEGEPYLVGPRQERAVAHVECAVARVPQPDLSAARALLVHDTRLEPAQVVVHRTCDEVTHLVARAHGEDRTLARLGREQPRALGGARAGVEVRGPHRQVEWRAGQLDALHLDVEAIRTGAGTSVGALVRAVAAVADRDLDAA